MRRLAAAAAILLGSVAAHAQSLGAPPAWLQDLGLTTAQQDAVFRIFYEQAPAIRSRLVAARQAHEALEELAIDGRLDSDEARALEDAQAEALAQVSALRLQAMIRVYQLLNAGQRARAVSLRRE